MAELDEYKPLSKEGQTAVATSGQNRKTACLTAWLVIAVVLLAGAVAAIVAVEVLRHSDDEGYPTSTKQEIRAHVRFLADPITQGRLAGSSGELLAAKYIAGNLESWGIDPAGDSGTFYQAVPMRIVKPSSPGNLTFSSTSSNSSFTATWYTQYTGSTQLTSSNVDLSNEEVVFAGFGISDSHMGWDDFKNVNVTGKVVVVLLGQPSTGIWNSSWARWAGRWTGKVETISERGAKALVIVSRYSYDGKTWASWQSGFGSSVTQLPSIFSSTPLSFYLWLAEAKATELAVMCGASNLSQWYTEAQSANFTPYTLNVTASLNSSFTFSSFNGTNVVGIKKGVFETDAVVLSAHYDSLGLRASDGAPYNGALDNSIGAAMTLAAARAISTVETLNRSVVFFFPTAENQGLLGSFYFVQQYKSKYNFLADVNYWSGNPFGCTEDVLIIGMVNSTLGSYLLPKACDAANMTCRPDYFDDGTMDQEAAGFFLYSDNIVFHRNGIPAVWIQQGWYYWGHTWADKYWKWVDDQIWACYHLPCDSFNESWSFDGTAQQANVGINTALIIAQSNYVPVIVGF